jgi:hypothetical protein
VSFPPFFLGRTVFPWRYDLSSSRNTRRSCTRRRATDAVTPLVLMSLESSNGAPRRAAAVARSNRETASHSLLAMLNSYVSVPFARLAYAACENPMSAS